VTRQCGSAALLCAIDQNSPDLRGMSPAPPGNEREGPCQYYRISKDPDGVVLFCYDCRHVEHIDAFDESVSSRRPLSRTGNADSLTGQARRGIGA
jgi:hypothetical protein